MAKKRFRPIIIPQNVKVTLSNSEIKVQGPLGNLLMQISPRVSVEIKENEIFVKCRDETKQAASHQGTMRSRIMNLINGVTSGFEKILIIQGTGYRAQLSGTNLQLFLGYAKPKVVALPKGITCELKVVKSAEKGDLTYITLKGIDKQAVGDLASQIKKVRIPDPYKHKGIRYAEEVLRKKVGKRAIVQA